MLQSLLFRLLPILPPQLRRVASPVRIDVLAQFVKFGTVGFVGLIVDTASVYGLRGWLGLYGAGAAAYGLAATATWLANRRWTFHGRGSGSAHRQWARFLAANL